MRTLFVLRHAAARGPGSAPTDFDRPLDARGLKQAASLGAIVRSHDLEAIVASPALRVVETIAGLGDGIGRGVEPSYDRRIYNASPESLLEIIRETDDRIKRLLIVGHNPGLELLLLELAQDDPHGRRREVAAGYATATLAELSLAVDQWREVGPRQGHIISLARGQD